jgi:hypothetical protein
MVFLLAVVLSAGLLVATNAAVLPDKSHKATVEFVSADANAKTITIKAEDGTEKTVPVEGKALEALKDLKAGDKIDLTCRDNDAGEHQAISEIAKAKAPAAKPEKKPEPKPKS